MIVSGGKLIAIDHVRSDNVTISGDGVVFPLGLTPSATLDAVYFSGKLNKNKYEQYFNINGTSLSAHPDVLYFNMSVNYTVETSAACPDFMYGTNVSFNSVDNWQYTNGNLPNIQYSYSYNILNNAENNTYNFTITNDEGINVKDVNISCLGVIHGISGPFEPTVSITALGYKDGKFLSFNNTILQTQGSV